MSNNNSFEETKPFLLLKSMPALAKYCHSKRFSLILLAVLLFILISSSVFFYFKSSKSVNKILLARESTLNAELTKMENVNDFLEAEILILKRQVKDLSQKKDRKKLQKISKYLADSNVDGRGVQISLKDSHSLFSPAQDESTIVHNTDLLKIVNFLWSYGAAAISINGERIVFNSHISCIGPTILVNKKRINSPFIIKAVGEKLNENTIKNNTFVLSLKLRGIEFEVTQEDNLHIPAGKYATFME
ncbi:MAG: DUF881 domain-containing protein [bacterium]|nr:DUF881 domain-containing protein [bacterium]